MEGICSIHRCRLQYESSRNSLKGTHICKMKTRDFLAAHGRNPLRFTTQLRQSSANRVHPIDTLAPEIQRICPLWSIGSGGGFL